MNTEELPKNILLVMPDKSIMLSRMVSFSENILFVQFYLKINKAVFTTEDNPSVKELYKKIHDIFN